MSDELKPPTIGPKKERAIGVWYMRYDPQSAEFCVVEPDGTTHVVNESAVFQDPALNRLIAAMARALTQPGFLFAQEPEHLAAYKKIASMGQMTDTLAVAHPDDAAVDALAVLMKAKLAKQRKKGYGGWETPRCTQYHLSVFLRDHVDKGDPVDVANFCAFLSARGEGIAPQPPAVIPLEHDEDWLEQMYWEFDAARQKSGDERLRFKGFMRAYGTKCANGLANLAQMEPDEGGAG